jgi:hypothetical protein
LPNIFDITIGRNRPSPTRAANSESAYSSNHNARP